MVSNNVVRVDSQLPALDAVAIEERSGVIAQAIPGAVAAIIGGVRDTLANMKADDLDVILEATPQGGARFRLVARRRAP